MYDSATEMQRGIQLQLLERGKVITDLKRQVKHFLILPDGTPIKTKTGKTSVYTSDFEYVDLENNEKIIEDCKGYKDDLSLFRIAVFEAINKVKVRIVTKNANGRNSGWNFNF